MAPGTPDPTPRGTPLEPQCILPDDLGLSGVMIDGRYLIEEVVGAGGFGVVFRARHVHFDSPVAIKVLVRSGARLSVLGNDASSAEGRLLFRLAPLHSAFVHVFEAGSVPCRGRGSLPYLAMEWLDGLTLKSLFALLVREERALALDTVLHLFDGLAQGLSVAHARRIAHRDLKPSNVFLTVTDGQVVPKLLDFGLAKQGSSTDDAYDDTAFATIPFTPTYGAPEQWDRGLGATGPWTDVYSFALMLVELLAGRRWNGDLTPGEAMRATLDTAQRPTPRALDAHVPPSVEAAFARALEVEPRRRFPNAERFWRALCDGAAWRHPGTPVLATALGIPVSARSGTASAADRMTPQTPSSRRLERIGSSLDATTLPPGSEPMPPRGELSGQATTVQPLPLAWRLRAARVASLLVAPALVAGVMVVVFGARLWPEATPPADPAPSGLVAPALSAPDAVTPAAVSGRPAPTARGMNGSVATASSQRVPRTDDSPPGGQATASATAGGARDRTQRLARAQRTAAPPVASSRGSAEPMPSSVPSAPPAILLEPPMVTRK